MTKDQQKEPRFFRIQNQNNENVEEEIEKDSFRFLGVKGSSFRLGKRDNPKRAGRKINKIPGHNPQVHL